MTSRLLACALVAWTAGCSATPDVDAWQQRSARPRARADRGELSAELLEVERLRREDLDLEAARRLALHVVAEHPDSPRALWTASQAESDAVYLLSDGEEPDGIRRRDYAALSALEYALEALELTDDPDVDQLAQLAWALGTTTHLQPTFDRVDHAEKTLAVIQLVLERDPTNVTAMATLSVLRLRLTQVPWFVSMFAPEGSVSEAEGLARLCVRHHPSAQFRLMLADALELQEKYGEARQILRAGEVDARYPRDAVLRPKLRARIARE